PKIIGDSCTSDQECTATILNGICNPTESQCDCVEGKVEYNETTCGEPKIIGDMCTSDEECTATILNGICNAESQCDCFGFKVEYNATTCAEIETGVRYWVGGNDVAEEGTWTWIDGSQGSPFDFSGWGRNEPNGGTRSFDPGLLDPDDSSMGRFDPGSFDPGLLDPGEW
ncbi:unnamed protein product, partial [Cyprideis torosa]